MRIVPIAMAALIVACSAAGPAAAQTKPGATASTVSAVLSELEKKIVDEYYRVKARVAPADTQAPASSGAPKKSTATMRGIPKEVGKAEDDDGASKGRGRGKGKSGELPPGLAKKDELPPGLAKKDKLPKGLRRDPLPAELAKKLPPAKPGTERILVGDDLVLIDKKTDVVLDFVKGAATPKS